MDGIYSDVPYMNTSLLSLNGSGIKSGTSSVMPSEADFNEKDIGISPSMTSHSSIL